MGDAGFAFHLTMRARPHGLTAQVALAFRLRIALAGVRIDITPQGSTPRGTRRSEAQIADIMGSALATVKSVASRAQQTLRRDVASFSDAEAA